MTAFGTYSIPSNFLTDLAQLKGNNLTGVAQVASTHISLSTPTDGNFLQAASSVPFIEPVRIEGRRIHADEKRMEIDKPYIIQYGKGTFMLRKDSKDRIHVYKLP